MCVDLSVDPWPRGCVLQTLPSVSSMTSLSLEHDVRLTLLCMAGLILGVSFSDKTVDSGTGGLFMKCEMR